MESTGPYAPLVGLIGVNPVFSTAAESAYANLAEFELQVNNVRVRLLRQNDEIAVDTVVAIAPDQDSVVLVLRVAIGRGNAETFNARIEVRDGEEVLFFGADKVIARAIPTGPAQSAEIELEYTGPGSTVAALDVKPDTTILATDTLVMRAVPRTTGQRPANVNPKWSVDDPSKATVTKTGVLKPRGPPGTVTVAARLPNNITGFATVTITSPP